MNEVFIDMRKENEWIKKYFNADFVSIEQLLGCIEDLDLEIDNLKGKIEELKKDNEPTADEWADYYMNKGMDSARGEE